MDDLVANLVGTAAPSPLGTNAGSSGRAGAGALRDQLRAAEKDVAEKRIVMAAIGAARGQKSADFGQTVFLVAYNLASLTTAPPLDSNRRRTSANISNGVPGSLSIVEEVNEMPGFEMMDFNSLDEAFGDAATVTDGKKARECSSQGDVEGGGLRGERVEQKVELVEVKIDFLAADGPRACDYSTLILPSDSHLLPSFRYLSSSSALVTSQ